jgi:hypothetical protein
MLSGVQLHVLIFALVCVSYSHALLSVMCLQFFVWWQPIDVFDVVHLAVIRTRTVFADEVPAIFTVSVLPFPLTSTFTEANTLLAWYIHSYQVCSLHWI